MVKYNILTKKYEFETNDPILADKFLKVLDICRFNYEDLYIAKKDIDFSQIIFRASREKRLQMEYIFRKMAGIRSIYLMDIDRTLSSIEVTGDDGYVIF